MLFVLFCFFPFFSRASQSAFTGGAIEPSSISGPPPPPRSRLFHQTEERSKEEARLDRLHFLFRHLFESTSDDWLLCTKKFLFSLSLFISDFANFEPLANRPSSFHLAIANTNGIQRADEHFVFRVAHEIQSSLFTFIFNHSLRREHTR